MSRKFAVVSLASLGLLAVIAGTLFWMLKHQPGFYREALAANVTPESRRRQAKEFVQSTLALRDEIQNETAWSGQFSEEAVNGWLAEELPVKYAGWLPQGVIAPRVKFEEGAVRLAFRHEAGAWSGVVSSCLRVWVAGPNQLALEIESVSAGLIPIPVDEVIGDLVAGMTAAGWKLQWKHTGQSDVLVVDFDGEAFHKVAEWGPILEAVEVGPKVLRVSGRRDVPPDEDGNDPAPVREAHDHAPAGVK